MRKWIKTYILSIRKDIAWLLFADLIFLLFMELVLRKIAAPYPIFVWFGDLFVTLAISFLASFIFYFVQIHLSKIKERKDIYPVIASLFSRMMDSEKSILTGLMGTKWDELTEDVIKKNVTKLNLYDKAPLVLGGPNGDRKANWVEYCLYRIRRFDKNWGMMMHYSSYLESEFMAILSRMQHPYGLLRFVRDTMQLSIETGHPLQVDPNTYGMFVDFWLFIKEQEDYYNRELKMYEMEVQK